MAPSGLKKALLFRAVELALLEWCGRDDLPAQIKEGIVKLSIKEELVVDFPAIFSRLSFWNEFLRGFVNRAALSECSKTECCGAPRTSFLMFPCRE